MLQQFLSRLTLFGLNSPTYEPDKYNGQSILSNNDSSMGTDYNPELITNLVKEHKDIVEISNSVKNLTHGSAA